MPMIEDAPLKADIKRGEAVTNLDKADVVRSTTNTEPILYEHLRRLMNDISNCWANYELAKLDHTLEDLYTLIRPRLKRKEAVVNMLDEKRDLAHNALVYTEAELKEICGYSALSYPVKMKRLRSKIYARARPLLSDFQAALYEQLYDLKLILGGGKNE